MQFFVCANAAQGKDSYRVDLNSVDLRGDF